jgi:hypothetical protein
MANIDKKKIRELLEKHNYVIRVSNINDIISISCPANFFLNINKTTINIYYDDDSQQVKINVAGIPAASKNIDCPLYAYGVLISIYIANLCSVFNIDTKFVVYNIDNEEVIEEEFVESIYYGNDMIKALSLQSFIMENMNNIQDDSVSNRAMELDVFEGYRAIREALYDKEEENTVEW